MSARQAAHRERGSRSIGLDAVAAGGVIALVAAFAIGSALRPERKSDPVHRRATRKARDGAAILGASVLMDSAMEHFRGGFHNRAMVLAPATAAASIAASLAEPRPDRTGRLPRLGHALSFAVGAAGLGFHFYNVTKRPGGLSWNNLFYAAPLGAPGALAISGLLGLTSEALSIAPVDGNRTGNEALAWSLPEAGRGLALATGGSLLVTAAEAGLLHFRGAFHNPAMWLPVTVPPATGLFLIGEAANPTDSGREVTRWAARGVAVLGVVGTAFHVWGVHRNMGGWHNWRQTSLAGPPTPAPISFTGLAMAGLAALDALGSEERSS
ncbi:hypothetical protein [Parvularcula oceani]|uniref:hypothetical protein n=1 Tax=Parvularcula oceani TaxID=1247963 RepID=UPI000B302194|nr:hypothetical protein [Parvularcula oceani]